MSPLDRIMRVFIGGSLIYLGFIGQTVISNDVLRTVLGVIGLLNIVAATLGICAMYFLANISTLKRQTDESLLLENQDTK